MLLFTVGAGKNPCESGDVRVGVTDRDRFRNGFYLQ